MLPTLSQQPRIQWELVSREAILKAACAPLDLSEMKASITGEAAAVLACHCFGDSGRPDRSLILSDPVRMKEDIGQMNFGQTIYATFDTTYLSWRFGTQDYLKEFAERYSEQKQSLRMDLLNTGIESPVADAMIKAIEVQYLKAFGLSHADLGMFEDTLLSAQQDKPIPSLPATIQSAREV